MKKGLLSVVAVLLFANVLAQDFKVLVGGSIGYTHNDTKAELWGTTSSSSSWSTDVQPYFMWAVTKRFYLGAHGTYSFQNNITANQKVTLWGGGAQVGYFLPITDYFFYNPMFRVGFYDIVGKVAADPTPINMNGWACGTELEVGSLKFKVNRFLLGVNFCTVQYTYKKVEARSLTTKANDWNVDFSIAPKLSLTFIVG